jgi:hypothetical protein
MNNLHRYLSLAILIGTATARSGPQPNATIVTSPAWWS